MKNYVKKIICSILILLNCFIQTMPCIAGTKTNSDNYINIHRTSKHLHSRLSKHYVGYIYTIKNVSSSPVEVSTISLKDNVTGDAAYLSVRRTGLGAATAVLASGVALALPTLTISVILSAVAVPFILVGNIFGNVGAHQESNRYSKDSKENILQPKESLTFTTLSKRLHTPQVTVIYKNPTTSEPSEIQLK